MMADTPRHSSEMTRIAIYSHDTFGLGNLRRMLAIAEALGDGGNAHILFLTGSPMVQGFRVSPQIDFIKLPCLSRDESGRYHSRSLPLPVSALITLRARLLKEALLSYRPHIVITDKKPLGVGGELEPAIEALSGDGQRPKFVLLLRDILDTPSITRNVWRRQGYHEAIARYYDLILVAGQPDVFNLAKSYRFPPATRRKLRYCGYIRRPRMAPKSRRDHALAVVTVGGGGDGFTLLKTYLTALKRSDDHGIRESVLLTGPEIRPGQRKQLKTLASGRDDVRWVDFVEDPTELFAKAGVVVSMCGYNSLCELLALGTPVVGVPRVRPTEEQRIRALAFARRGLMQVVEPERLTPESLMAALMHARAGHETVQAIRPLDFGGLDRIRYWIQRLLASGRDQGVVPSPLSSSAIAETG